MTRNWEALVASRARVIAFQAQIRANEIALEGVEQDLSDQWFEGYIKPALSGAYTFASSSQLYGKVSVVGERTYGSVPEPFGTDVSSFGPEDGYIGWRSGKSIGSPLRAYARGACELMIVAGVAGQDVAVLRTRGPSRRGRAHFNRDNRNGSMIISMRRLMS